MSSSQCTNAPKKASYLLSSWLWLTLEAISILQQERACPNKLDFHPLLFSPLSTWHFSTLWHFSLNIFSFSCSGVFKDLWWPFKEDPPTASYLNHFFGSGYLVFCWWLIILLHKVWNKVPGCHAALCQWGANHNGVKTQQAACAWVWRGGCEEEFVVGN